MSFSNRFKVRAALVLSAAGAIAAFGACGKDTPTQPPPVNPPPPPAAIPAPTGLAATAVSATRINLTWTESATNETGFGVERCSGANCTNFAAIGTVAANTTTYGDSVGLVAATQYSYRVRAFNATDTSQFSATASATTTGVVASNSFVLVGAGEITSCGVGKATATAALVDQVLAETPDAIVFTAGNNVNDSLSSKAATAYTDCFDPVWGKFKPHMRAALGQQDYRTVNSTSSMYNYFGDAIPGGANGWYSFDLGTNWHIIVLNTASWQWGTCNMTGAGSNPECVGKPTPMLDWLSADLIANAGKRCIGVISWERRFYSGTGATFMNSNMRTISRMLVDAGVDFLVSAKDKLYSRFAPQSFEGAADPNGIRQFIVGTGGRSLDNAAGLTNPPNLEVRDATTQGVLKLTLTDTAYEWKFMPIAGGTFTDTGKTDCHQ